MVAYRYATKVAFVKGSPNTLVANASVLVYALTDSGFTNPILAYSDRELTTITNIVTDENGIPETDFFLDDHPDCRWKSGTMTGEWATTQSRPGLRGPVSTVPGPPGDTGTPGTPGLNGANASILEDPEEPGLYYPIEGEQLSEDVANPGLYVVTGYAPTSKRIVSVDAGFALPEPVLDALGATYIGKGAATIAAVNTIYVSPTGSDANTGRTVGNPLQTFQAAFDLLKLEGPVIQGTWEIIAAAGTYPVTTQQTLTTRSVNRVIVRGPSVSGGVPTAVIDGAGGAAYAHGLSASGVGVRVEFRDLKFINFTAGGGDTTRIGCLGENESDFYANNVHATGASWAGVYAFNTVRARIFGGIFDGCRDGVAVNDTDATVGQSTAPVTIKNSTEFGLYWSRGSQGHADYVTFEDNSIGLMIDASSRVDTVACDFKRNTIAISTRTGGIYNEGGATNTYNDGGADANITNFDFKASSGNGTELAGARSWVSPTYDRSTRTVTGVTVSTPLNASIYTVAARRLQGVGKQLRFHALGIHTVTAGTAYTVTIGGMSIPLTVPAAATAVPFEIDVMLMEVQGGYRAIGVIRQGLSAHRYATVTSGFDSAAANTVGLAVTPANAADTTSVYHSDVYLMG